MKIGANSVTAAYLGSTAIGAAYLGATQVFSAGPDEPTITIATPTFSDDFNAYADGTRLVAGDPNANAGLVATNPGNLGWSVFTTATQNNARFNPIIFQGQVRERTANNFGDPGVGAQLLAPAGLTQSGAQYAQMVVSPNAENSRQPSVTILATDQRNRLDLRVNSATAGATTVLLRHINAGTDAAVSGNSGAAPGGAAYRMGGTSNASFRSFDNTETFTAIHTNGRAYIRRGPGYPIGDLAGTAFTALAGTRFGFSTHGSRPTYVDAVRFGPAPLFITVDETHRNWVPKKRASASDPITAGVGDETFTGTYVGTIPSRMQWALFDMGTGALVKDWALVPDTDFTAGSGTWSARLRAIPSGLNGRGAYGVGFRPVDATDQTDPAWQCVSNKEFFVTLNVGVVGQSNAGKLMSDPVTGTQYPRVDGLLQYSKADPPSLVQGNYNPTPQFWSQGTAGVAVTGRCTYLLGDYLADLHDLPISFEALAIAARGAPTLGPIDVTTGVAHPSSDWDYIQTHHAFAGGAYDLIYLSQGENEFNTGSANWLNQWVANLSAYRDPSMHGQPAGTVIPVLYAITGISTDAVPDRNAAAQETRLLQYSLAASVSDCYIAHSYTGCELIDSVHLVATKDEGYNEVARRIKLTCDKLFNAGPYDGRGPIANSASRSGAVITVSFDLNGASSLTTRDGRDQTLAGNANALTSWQVSANDFASNLTISSAVQTGNTVVITLSADPGGPVKVRNHWGSNPDVSSFPAGSYADGTFICMMPLVNALTAA